MHCKEVKEVEWCRNTPAVDWTHTAAAMSQNGVVRHIREVMLQKIDEERSCLFDAQHYLLGGAINKNAVVTGRVTNTNRIFYRWMAA
jgi:hypothetical protein